MSTANWKTDRGLLAAIAFIAVSLVACFAIAHADEAKTAGGKTQLSSQDAKFLEKAAQGGNAEVQEARMAQRLANSDHVKEAARQLEKDHTAANDKLRSIARSQGAEAPAQPAEDRMAKMEQLKTNKGAEFDREYVRSQVDAHEKTVALFEDQVKNGQNQQLKAFAKETLPTLKEHLQMMRDMQRMQTAEK